MRKFSLLGATLSIFILNVALGQGSGFGGGGLGAAHHADDGSPSSQVQTASANTSQFVAVSGTAVISVKPEAVRLVFAVTADGENSQACAETVKIAIESIRKGTAALGIAPENFVEDFIVVAQQYQWELAKVKFKSDQPAGERNPPRQAAEEEMAKLVREVPNGFRMQTNLHVLCKDEQQAMAVMNVAFEAGVNDIISFDYWHSEIDQYKKEALKKAIDQANSKADILLAVFDKRPELLNISSTAKTQYPESLYRTLTPKASSNDTVPYSWRNYAKIRAPRPLITFYQGSKDYADLSPVRPSMRPEIAVSATVTLTYGSPARDDAMELERLKAASKKDPPVQR